MGPSKKQNNTLFQTIWVKTLIVGILGTLLASLAFGISVLLFSNMPTQNGKATTPIQTVKKIPMSPAEQDALAVQTVAHEYMKALLAQNYHAMWSVLHPQRQALWPSEAAFTTFWQTHFKDYTLQNFKLGQVYKLSYWVDPETMKQYIQVLELPVSLQLVPKATQLQGAVGSLPPEILHPSQVFQKVPFIVQNIGDINNQEVRGGHWVVLNAGPADLEAPILPPLNPANKIIQVPILMYHHITDAPTYNVYLQNPLFSPLMTDTRMPTHLPIPY